MSRIVTGYREDAKKRIITAALEVVAESGWDALTLDAIAQKVGVTKGALYAYFPNGDALRREMIVQVVNDISASIGKTLSIGTDVPSAFAAYADVIFDQTRPHAAIFCQLPVRIPQDSPYHESFVRAFDGTVHSVREYLAQERSRGTVPHDLDPDMAASAIVALSMGLWASSLSLGKDSGATKRIFLIAVQQLLPLPAERP